MKKFSLLLVSLLMVSEFAMAQEKVCVHKIDGSKVVFLATQVEYVNLEGNSVIPDDEPIIPGNDSFVAKPFSVSAEKFVIFSSGNLQYSAVNEEWRFAPEQTDCKGSDNEDVNIFYNIWIDLFGWGTGNHPTNKSRDNEFYPAFVDWGLNKIGEDAPKTWRTLTYEEWHYIRWERPNFDKLIGVAEVNGVNGLILLPDNWVCPSEVNFKSGFSEDNGPQYFASHQTITASDWSLLEASGAVFLPACGFRQGSDVFESRSEGCYWTANEYNEERGKHLAFKSTKSTVSNAERLRAFSVRLVKDYIKNDEKPEVPEIKEHEYVDLGLTSGLLWATMNIGATSPEDYGDYFAWGETEPKDYYDWDNYKFMADGMSSWRGINKYTIESEDVNTAWYNESGEFIGDNKTIIELSDDAARVNWGDDWRMPTKEEQDELRAECTWTWMNNNGVNGHLVTGPNGNSIFLPAAGHCYYSEPSEVGNRGYYWSSSLREEVVSNACYLVAYPDDIDWSGGLRCSGRTIRPVRTKQN